MSITLDGTNGITAPTYGSAVAAEYLVPVTGFKNRIINGAMVIDQRNAGASGTAVNVYTVDRWYYQASQASKGTWQQNAGAVTPPVGFSNYLGFTSSSAYAVLAGDYFRFYQSIEGLNTYDLAWGTANAKAVTFSFQVYSSLTGTFGGSFQNNSVNRSYPFTYSIPVANTWTSISITVAGDTTGTWLTTNGTGLLVCLALGVGSTFSGTAGSWSGGNYLSATGATSVVGTNGATFYITGVQLEKGSTATSFDYRPYGTELQLCQRYYQIKGAVVTASNIYQSIHFLATMRTTPTIGTVTFESGTGATFANSNFGATTEHIYQNASHSATAQANIPLSAEL